MRRISIDLNKINKYNIIVFLFHIIAQKRKKEKSKINWKLWKLFIDDIINRIFWFSIYEFRV